MVYSSIVIIIQKFSFADVPLNDMWGIVQPITLHSVWKGNQGGNMSRFADFEHHFQASVGGYIPNIPNSRVMRKLGHLPTTPVDQAPQSDSMQFENPLHMDDHQERS